MSASTQIRNATRGDIGHGVYGLADLRAYLALSGEPKDADRALPWLTEILNPVAHRPRHADYSFSDLISLFVVRFLLQKGVKAKAIRDAEQYLRKDLDTDRPFLHDQIKTDGCNVFFRDELIAGQLEAADLHGQQTMREPVKDRLTSVHYNNGEAVYWAPYRNVMLDPKIQFGEPVIAGTRLPTGVVAEVVQHLGHDEAAERFSISPKVVSSAVDFERKLAAVAS